MKRPTTGKNEFRDHTLNNFSILSELGKGSYGVVYKVKSNLDNNLYVLKKINLTHIKNQNEALKEAKLLRSLKHPNIIMYYMSFIEENYLCIVMEYAEGGDLQKYLKEQKENYQYISEEIIWKMSKELCNALQHIHQNNIIHRDIKALNIFLSRDKQVKLGDLGVSKIFTSDVALHGTRVGTPLYLAPELVQHQPYDQKVDIWALGCVLYYLCALELPFQGENLITLGYNIVNKSPKPIPPQYSQRLTQFIWKLLEKIPVQRPTISEALNEYFESKSIQIKNQVTVFQQINSTSDDNPYQFEKRKQRPQTSNISSTNSTLDAEKQMKMKKMFQQSQGVNCSPQQMKLKGIQNKADQYYALVKQEQLLLENEEKVEKIEKDQQQNQGIQNKSINKSKVELDQKIKKQQVCYDEPHHSARILKIQQNQIELYLDDKILQKQNQQSLIDENDNFNKQNQKKHMLMQIRPLSSQARSYSLKNLASQPKQSFLSNKQEGRKFTIFDLKGDKDHVIDDKMISDIKDEKQNQFKNPEPIFPYQKKIEYPIQQNNNTQINRIQSAFLISNQKKNLLQSQQQANQIVKHYTLKDLLEI